MEWKDITTYSQDDTKHLPNNWEYCISSLIIHIHRHIHYEKDRWLISCSALNVNKIPLMNKNIKKAQSEGLNFINNLLLKYTYVQKLLEKQLKEEDKKMCEHKNVLKIYTDPTHTKISHYRCAECGEKREEQFGQKII